MTRSSNRPLRVLHAPELVGGHAGRLAVAEREAGLQSHCITLHSSPYGFQHDESLWANGNSVVQQEISRWRLLMRALSSFDVIHFNFGMSILPAPGEARPVPVGAVHRLLRDLYTVYVKAFALKDLPLLKLARKAIFVTYQGDDARQGDYCKAHFSVSPVGEVDAGYYTAEGDARKRREIAVFEQYADGIFALNPDLLHVLPPRARFLPYGHVDPRRWQPVALPGTGSRPLVVHAPSHRGAKGTRFVLDAVSRLRAEGIGFDFTLVEGVRNEDARRIYEKADLVIDQLLVGWYGGFAVECMALGKPVICYVREGDLRYIEPEMRSQLPVIRAEPSTLYSVLKEHLTSRRHRLRDIGALGRAYVERWHDPIRIGRFLRGEYISALEHKGWVFDDPPSRPSAAPTVATAPSGLKNVLILSFTDLTSDPRVNRQIRLLADRFRVTAAGLTDPVVPGVTFCQIPGRHWAGLDKSAAALLLTLRQFERAYWSSRSVRAGFAQLKDRRFDLIVANDILALPLALSIRNGAKIVLDAHEYAPLEFEDRWSWRFFFRRFYDYLCRAYLARADGMITVCQGIADEYRVNYGVHPVVLMNAPPYHELAPLPTNPDRVRMVHHGVVITSRKIELMIQTMDHLDERFHLDLILVPNVSRYFSSLVSLAAKHPRVRILPPVPMHELPRRLNEYDIGVYLLPPTNFNYRHVLPNKFFEFIQARLAIAIGPSPEMAKLVRQYGCGIVAEDFNPRTLAARLNELSNHQIDRFKQNSHLAARRLCFENNATILLAMIDRLVQRG